MEKSVGTFLPYALATLIVVLTGLMSPARAAGELVDSRVLGQAASEAALAEANDLFQQMLRDPTNLDLAFRYAELSAAIGRFEQAITALEQMLFFNPNLPRVSLELGVLYFRLGSFGAARAYLERAAAAPDAPAPVRDRIAEYLTRIDRLQSRHQWSGTAFAGIQAQSNANAAPASPAVRALGNDATLADQFTKRSDYNLFATSTVLYSYRFDDLDRDTIEVGATVFGARYAEQGQLNLAFAEASIGPRINFSGPAGWGAGIENASVRPFLLGNYVSLGNEPFFSTYGGGLEGTVVLPWSVSLRAAYERRQKNYRNTADRQLNRQLTGSEDVFSLTLSRPITDTSLLGLTISKIDQSARTSFDSNAEYGGALSYQIYYASPIPDQETIWQTTLTVGRYWTNYGAPDPLFDPDVTRFDRRWRLGASQAIGITTDISVILQAQRDIVSSSLPNFAYTNWSFLVGPQWRF